MVRDTCSVALILLLQGLHLDLLIIIRFVGQLYPYRPLSFQTRPGCSAWRAGSPVRQASCRARPPGGEPGSGVPLLRHLPLLAVGLLAYIVSVRHLTVRWFLCLTPRTSPASSNSHPQRNFSFRPLRRISHRVSCGPARIIHSQCTNVTTTVLSAIYSPIKKPSLANSSARVPTRMPPPPPTQQQRAL